MRDLALVSSKVELGIRPGVSHPCHRVLVYSGRPSQHRQILGQKAAENNCHPEVPEPLLAQIANLAFMTQPLSDWGGPMKSP